MPSIDLLAPVQRNLFTGSLGDRSRREAGPQSQVAKRLISSSSI